MKLRVRAFDSAMFYRSEFCFISKCSRKCWGASEKCVTHFVLFMSVHDWCSSHLSRIFLKWNNIRIDKTQQNRTPWLVASFSAVQIQKIFTEARVMSTNVKSLEKIYATELYKGFTEPGHGSQWAVASERRHIIIFVKEWLSWNWTNITSAEA